MIFPTSLALLVLSVSASSSSTAPAAAPTAPANTAGHVNVNVGPQLVFSPANITASNGTVVTFYFPDSVSHSVTQSSFADPCTYLAANGSTSGGFDSGLTEGKEFSITITDDTKPIWYFCKQVTHCGLGMVGSINAPQTGNTFAAFQAAALKIGSSETTVPDNGPVTGGVNANATSGPTSGAASSASATTSAKSPGNTTSSAGRVVVTTWAMVATVLAAACLL